MVRMIWMMDMLGNMFVYLFSLLYQNKYLQTVALFGVKLNWVGLGSDASYLK